MGEPKDCFAPNCCRLCRNPAIQKLPLPLAGRAATFTLRSSDLLSPGAIGGKPLPYRHAHWWILGLFPLIAVAFWPGYLGRFGNAPFALHAHGFTATAWLVLLALQSWSIHHGTPARHRAVGLATFVVLPLFAAAGPLALQGMATLWRARSDPFHATYGDRLVIADMIAGPSVVAMVVYAFVNTRRVRAHSSAMLATALLVLPPIIGRLLPAVPGFPKGGWAGFGGFRFSFQLSEALTLIIAVLLATRARGGAGFGFAAAATAAQMIGFEVVAGIPWWDRWVVFLTDLPTFGISVAAGSVTIALLIWAWKRVPPRSATTGPAPQVDRSSLAGL